MHGSLDADAQRPGPGPNRARPRATQGSEVPLRTYFSALLVANY
jgi:hypothetical protein